MVAVFVSLGLMIGTWAILRGGFFVQGQSWRFSGIDTNALALTGIAVIAAIYYFGPVFGFAFVAGIALHEFGHVAAFRICGRPEASFRLVPLMGGITYSLPPRRHDEQIFISLMGPAICLAPMCLSFALSAVLMDTWPMGSDWLYVFAITLGSFNFLNLLPLWPLDGGHIVQVLTASLWPAQSRNVTILISGLALVMAIWLRSIFWMVMVALSVRSVFTAEAAAASQERMTPRRAALAAACYLATGLAFYQAGGQFLLAMFGN